MISGEPLATWLAVQTFSQEVSMSALQAQGRGFDPHCSKECYIGAVSETMPGCGVWKDTCPPAVGLFGAVRMVHDFLF